MTEEAAEKGLPFINYPHLHRQVWAKEHFRAEAKQEETKFTGDYTQVPRGRVAWNVNKFIVLVGKWAKPVAEELGTSAPPTAPEGASCACCQECRVLCPPSGGEGGAGRYEIITPK
jgi:hypothetical protein